MVKLVLLNLSPVAACTAHDNGATTAGRQKLMLTLNVHDLHRGLLINLLFHHSIRLISEIRGFTVTTETLRSQRFSLLLNIKISEFSVPLW